MMGRVVGEIQDGVCIVADEAPGLLPQRRPGVEPLAEPAGPAVIPSTRQGADPPRMPPDLDVLGKVLAGLRRLA
jgi:hypothetical protein